MNTYAKRAANPNGMRTYKIIALKASCNEHLQKRGRGAGPSGGQNESPATPNQYCCSLPGAMIYVQQVLGRRM
jgi:hypothetical protein